MVLWIETRLRDDPDDVYLYVDVHRYSSNRTLRAWWWFNDHGGWES